MQAQQGRRGLRLIVNRTTTVSRRVTGMISAIVLTCCMVMGTVGFAMPQQAMASAVVNTNDHPMLDQTHWTVYKSGTYYNPLPKAPEIHSDQILSRTATASTITARLRNTRTDLYGPLQIRVEDETGRTVADWTDCNGTTCLAGNLKSGTVYHIMVRYSGGIQYGYSASDANLKMAMTTGASEYRIIIPASAQAGGSSVGVRPDASAEFDLGAGGHVDVAVDTTQSGVVDSAITLRRQNASTGSFTSNITVGSAALPANGSIASFRSANDDAARITFSGPAAGTTLPSGNYRANVVFTISYGED